MNQQPEPNDSVTPIVIPSYAKQSPKKKRFRQFFRPKKKQKKEPKKKKQRVLRQTSDILPFLRMEKDHIVLKNNALMDILQITPQDILSKTDHERQLLTFTRTKFFRSYFPDIKEVGLNFPTSTAEQQQYWRKKRVKAEAAGNALRVQFIDRKLFELTYLEKERTNREFFLFIYATNENELFDLRQQAIKGYQQAFSLQQLTNEKKQNIIFYLNNLNSKL